MCSPRQERFALLRRFLFRSGQVSPYLVRRALDRYRQMEPDPLPFLLATPSPSLRSPILRSPTGSTSGWEPPIARLALLSIALSQSFSRPHLSELDRTRLL